METRSTQLLTSSRSVPSSCFTYDSVPENMSCALSAVFWSNFFHLIKCCHCFHAYSKCFTLPLPISAATKALAPVGCVNIFISHFQTFAFKILKWLIQNLYRVFKAFLSPFVLPVFFQMTTIPDSSSVRLVLPDLVFCSLAWLWKRYKLLWLMVWCTGTHEQKS